MTVVTLQTGARQTKVLASARSSALVASQGSPERVPRYRSTASMVSNVLLAFVAGGLVVAFIWIRSSRRYGTLPDKDTPVKGRPQDPVTLYGEVQSAISAST